jgi:hypothetical protein
MGTPVRRAVTSPGLRHVDVKALHQMVPGDPYLGWVCKNKSCGLVIAIALPPAGSKPALTESGDQLAAIKCPHCGDEDLYRWSARSELKYAARAAATWSIGRWKLWILRRIAADVVPGRLRADEDVHFNLNARIAVNGTESHSVHFAVVYPTQRAPTGFAEA